MPKINYGKDKNFFRKITVSELAFPEEPQIKIDTGGQQGFSLINLGTAANQSIEYSFNGNVLHGDLVPGTPSAGMVWDNRTVYYIWFRTVSASSEIRVEAW